MSILNFATELRNRGIARQSHYVVEIVPPPFYSTPMDESFIPLFCEQAQLPEIALMTDTIKDNGLFREAVYDKAYGSVTMTFACDQNMIVKSFFDKWVLGTVMSKGGVFAYPKEYTAPWMQIHQLNQALDTVYSVRLTNVYPKVVNDVILTANSRDYNRVQVMFVYESWDSQVNVMNDSYVNKINQDVAAGKEPDFNSVKKGIIQAGAGLMTGEYNNGAGNTDYTKTKLNSLMGAQKSLVDNLTDWK